MLGGFTFFWRWDLGAARVWGVVLSIFVCGGEVEMWVLCQTKVLHPRRDPYPIETL